MAREEDEQNQDENCVEMNTWHERKMSRIKTYFKGKKRLDKGKKKPIQFKVEKEDIINKKLECKK